MEATVADSADPAQWLAAMTALLRQRVVAGHDSYSALVLWVP